MNKFEEREMVQIQYQPSLGPASGSALTHKRVFALLEWPDTARRQVDHARRIVAVFESVPMDKIRIADINTIGSVYVEE